jgi:cytochrome c oxidase subunit 2
MRALTNLELLVMAAVVLAGTGCGYKVPEQATARGDELFKLCVECHGEAGEGIADYHAPSIAGLPSWYVETQLNKFKSGMRGSHPADRTGQMMRPMTMSFRNEADLKTIAAYVSTLPTTKPAATLADGDANRGKALFAVCTACHGADAAGNQQMKAPPLTHSSDWYLVEQLRKFKGGQRGANPADVEGATMRPMMATLTDDQAIKDVVAHIATLGR